MSKEVKHSKLRKEMAVKYVVSGILNGMTYSQLLDSLMNDKYGLGIEYCRSYSNKIIYEARQQIKDDYKKYVPELKSILTSICFDIMQECRTKGDAKNALRTVDYIAKLSGAYEPDKIDVKVNDVVIDFGFKDNNNDES